jgi:hypothetical protein
MSWVFDHLGLIIFLGVGYSIWRKAKSFLRQVGEETGRRAPSGPVARQDPDEVERVRRIQEEIRRKIAERRGGDQRTLATPLPTAEPPPLSRRAGIPPVDPFGGTVRRMIDQLERRLQPPPVPPPLERPRIDAAQLERQEQIAEQMRVLGESRLLVARRATQLAASVKTEAESERGSLTLSRKNLLAELRDPQSLRRAFVLREVLGAPVGLH